MAGERTRPRAWYLYVLTLSWSPQRCGLLCSSHPSACSLGSFICSLLPKISQVPSVSVALMLYPLDVGFLRSLSQYFLLGLLILFSTGHLYLE